MTIGMKAVISYLDLPDDISLKGDLHSQNIKYGPLNIHTYGETPTFLINYAGPPSGHMVPGENRPWKTFPRYPLSNILDVAEITLSDPLEDTDWMDQFLPGVIPDYILAMEDPEQRQMIMDLMIQ